MRATIACWVSILVVLFADPGYGFNLLHPESHMHAYSTGDYICAKVNSLTSIENALPFSYYSLPYCKPLSGIKRSPQMNLGQLLLGDQVLNSPYRFRMNSNESVYLCTTHPLSKDEVKLLKQRSRDLYQVNMILDNLPVMRFAKYSGANIRWTGFPVGYTHRVLNDREDYIINHLKFRVLIHENESRAVEILGIGGEGERTVSESELEKRAVGYEIVGFEVVPCSVKHNPEAMSKLRMYDHAPSVYCPLELKKSQVIKEQERVSFTYEVEFVKSDIKWSSRWDAYLKTEGGDRAHRFSIINSILIIFLLAGIISVILLRNVRRDLICDDEFDTKSQKQINIEAVSKWKLLVGEVFREPHCAKLLCVMVGNGVQITVMALVTIVLAVVGSLTPASQGMLLTGMIHLYLFSGFPAGYVAVSLWGTIKGNSADWSAVSWSVACFFPGIVFIIVTTMDFILQGSSSTRALSVSLYLALFSIWFCLSVPLTLLGGFLATRGNRKIQYIVLTSELPREIPASKYPSWLILLGAGTFPFGTLHIELFYVCSSIWLGRFYSTYGFLMIVLLLLLIVCAETSVIVTYMGLSEEDWRWWWKAFFASGLAGLYVFLYFVNFLVSDLRGLIGPVSATLYLGYSLIIATAIMLATGSVGFLISFYFVKYLYFLVI